MSDIPALRVEMQDGCTWVDVTDKAVPDQLAITYGRTSEDADPRPSSCSLKLSNVDPRFAPPRRVRIAVIYDGVTRTRFDGELTEW